MYNRLGFGNSPTSAVVFQPLTFGVSLVLLFRHCGEPFQLHRVELPSPSEVFRAQPTIMHISYILHLRRLTSSSLSG